MGTWLVAVELQTVTIMDAHLLSFKKRYVSDDQLRSTVASVWPDAHEEGAVGSKSWTYPPTSNAIEDVVAEAWMHPTRLGWWLRIKPRGE